MSATTANEPRGPTMPALDKRLLRRELSWTRTPFASTAVVVALLAILPFVWRNDYIVSLLTLIFIYSIFTQSWNITIGFCGIWNFGHLAIVALGAYASGLMIVKVGISPWLGLLVGMVAGGLVGVILVLPSIKLRGIYASMLTFAFAEVVRLLIIADSSGFTGGVFGLTGIEGLFDWLSPLGSLRAYYWFTLFVAALVMLVIHRMTISPFGMGLVGLRESIRFSIGMGIDRRVQFIAATAFSGIIAGLGGALFAGFYHSITPTIMGLGPMGLFVTMVVVGGLGTVRGPIVGTFLVMIVSELLRDTVMWRLVVQGAILLIVLAFFPAGVDSLAVRGFRKVKEWMAEGQAGGEGEAAGPPDAGGSGPAASDRSMAAAVAAGSAATSSMSAATAGGGPSVAGALTDVTATTSGPPAGAGDVPAAGPAEGTPAAPAAGVPVEAPAKKGGFKGWLNADQPAGQAGGTTGRIKEPKAPKTPKEKREKAGGFKAWLNADQPPKDEKKD